MVLASFVIQCLRSINRFIGWYSINKKALKAYPRLHYERCLQIIRRVTSLASSTQLLERGSSSFLSLPLFPHFLPALPSSAHGSLLALRAVASLSLYEAASQMAQVACPQKDAHRLQISSASDPCPIPTQSNKTSANYCFKQHILNYASNSFRSWEARMYQYNQDRGETTSLDIGHQESHSTQLMMDFNK